MASQKILGNGNKFLASPLCGKKTSQETKKLKKAYPEQNGLEFPPSEKYFLKIKEKKMVHKKKEENKYKKSKLDGSQPASLTTCSKLENVDLLNQYLVKSSSSKKMRCPLELQNILLPNEESDAVSSAKVKKAKKKKQQVHFESKLPDDCPPQKQQHVQATQSSKKKMQPPREAEPLSSSLSSPSSLPKAFLEDKSGVPGKGEDASSVSDYSQDLFITQKRFLPPRLLSASQDSPPLGQKRLRRLTLDRGMSQSSSSEMQSLCKREDLANKKQGFGATLAEKASQTDDLFSYLSLMTYLNRVKTLEACSEKPLNLSMKSCASGSMQCQGRTSVEDNEVIIISSSSPSTALKGKIKAEIVLSPPNRFNEPKLVQTVLNTSYFFKGKGEHGELSPITPLIKLKVEKPKKCGRKSSDIKKTSSKA